MLEGLFTQSDLGIPQDPPGDAGKCLWEEGCLGLLSGSVASAT